MLTAIRDLIVYRLIGGRLLLALTLLGIVRRLIGRRRGAPPTSGYQPSQGESQIVQREPR